MTGPLRLYSLVGGPEHSVLPLIRNRDGELAQTYSAARSSAYIVRPDGYLGVASAGIDADALVAHLRATFG
ncbi:hypothetical protein [Mycobacterium sp. URHB0021]